MNKKQKLAEKSAKAAAKKSKIKSKFGKCILATAMLTAVAGCASSEPASRVTEGRYGDIEPAIEICIERGAASNTVNITLPLTIGDAAYATADSKGSTETTTASPTQTTDTKPNVDVNTTGGKTAGLLETVVGAGVQLMKQGDASSGSGATCTDGSCSSCPAGACSDCSVK